MSTITITFDQIDELFNRIASTPPDLSPEIRVGDWVRVNEPHRGEAYSRGHVAKVGEGTITLAYGDKNTPREFRLRFYGLETPINVRWVAEHWRRVDVVTEGTTTTPDGGTISHRSMDYEWKQIR